MTGPKGRRLPRLPSDNARDADREAAEEIRFHLASVEEELLARGWSDEDARAEALRRFGDPERARRDLKEMTMYRARKEGRRSLLAELGQDAAFGRRLFRRRPGVAMAAVLTLGIGIGAASAVWSVTDLLLLRPLPFHEPHELVALQWDERAASAEELVYLRERARAHSEIAGASSGWTTAWTQTGDPTQLSGTAVTTNYLSTLGVAPARGRHFQPQEARAGGTPVVALSHALWRDRLGEDPEVLGRTLTLNGEPHEVVAVMPPGFDDYLDTDFWFPFEIDPDSWTYTGGILDLVARLAPGAAPETAGRELRGLLDARRRETGLPDDYARDARVVSLRDRVIGDADRMVVVVFGAVLFALLIAIANTAGLFLAQATARERELGVRAALGAGRHRIVRQLASEALLLALAGAGLGLLVGSAGVGLLKGFLPPDTPRLGEVALDPRVMAGGIALAMSSALLVALVAAAWGTRRDPGEALRLGSRGTSGAGARGRATLVVVQVALTTVLLGGSVLMIRTMAALAGVDPGFGAEDVLTMRIQPSSGADESAGAFLSRFDRLLEHVEGVPGVASAAAVHHLPMSGSSWTAPLEVYGRPLPPGSPPYMAGWRIATGHYFATLGIPLLEGRDFRPMDHREAEPVLILSRRAARDLFGDGSALGQRVKAGNATRGEYATVIGVVGDVRHGALDEDPPPTIYRPHTQHPMVAMMLAVRTSMSPARLAPSIREALRSAEPDLPITGVRPMRDMVRASIAAERSVFILLSAFAGVGLMLALIGIYGIVAYGVRTRTRELGIRIALGARGPRVEAGVVAEGLLQTSIGVVAGGLLSVPLTAGLGGLLYGVSPGSPTAVGAAGGVLLLAGALASWVPARRAARVDPAGVLRQE